MSQAQIATILIQSLDETLLKDDTAIQQRWRKHFEVHLNRTTAVTGDTILSTPQHPERPSLDIIATLDGVQRVTMQMKTYKAYGPDKFFNVWRRESSKQAM